MICAMYMEEGELSLMFHLIWGSRYKVTSTHIIVATINGAERAHYICLNLEFGPMESEISLYMLMIMIQIEKTHMIEVNDDSFQSCSE